MTPQDDRIAILTRYLGLLTRLGLLMSVCIIGGFLIGYWLTSHYKLPKIILVLTTVAGVGTGFYLLYKEVLKDLHNDT